jgi:hypothetical protein
MFSESNQIAQIHPQSHIAAATTRRHSQANQTALWPSSVSPAFGYSDSQNRRWSQLYNCLLSSMKFHFSNSCNKAADAPYPILRARSLIEIHHALPFDKTTNLRTDGPPVQRELHDERVWQHDKLVAEQCELQRVQFARDRLALQRDDDAVRRRQRAPQHDDRLEQPFIS